MNDGVQAAPDMAEEPGGDLYAVYLTVRGRFMLKGVHPRDAGTIGREQARLVVPADADGVEWEVRKIQVLRRDEDVCAVAAPPADPDVIRGRMEELGIRSAREVARRTVHDPEGVLSHTAVNLMLRGQRVSRPTRRKVARALGMPSDWLY